MRHTFAVRTAIDWYRTGKDPARASEEIAALVARNGGDLELRNLATVAELTSPAQERFVEALRAELAEGSSFLDVHAHPGRLPDVDWDKLLAGQGRGSLPEDGVIQALLEFLLKKP